MENPNTSSDPGDILNRLRNADPLFCINPMHKAVEAIPANPDLSLRAVQDAEARLQRFAPVLEKLFDELESTRGIIESELMTAHRLKDRLFEKAGHAFKGKLLIKCDHALPVAGSTKARGGIYAVLHLAERIAVETGLIHAASQDYTPLLSDAAKSVFRKHTLSVASTGNLGLSVGIIGTALGFPVNVFTSTEAKEWKKASRRAEKTVDKTPAATE